MLRWCLCLALAFTALLAAAQLRLPAITSPPHVTPSHLTFRVEWGDVSLTSYGVLVFTNGQPAAFQERTITTVLSNADFTVSNLPPSIDAIAAFAIFRNGALSWTSSPAITKWMVVYERGQLATNVAESKTLMGPWTPLQTNQFVPLGTKFFRGTNRIALSNFNAGVFFHRD